MLEAALLIPSVALRAKLKSHTHTSIISDVKSLGSDLEFLERLGVSKKDVLSARLGGIEWGPAISMRLEPSDELFIPVYIVGFEAKTQSLRELLNGLVNTYKADHFKERGQVISKAIESFLVA